MDALRCLPQEAALRALAHLAQAVSSIQISTVRSVPAYIMSIIAKHQPGREGRLRDNPREPAQAAHAGLILSLPCVWLLAHPVCLLCIHAGQRYQIQYTSAL